MQAQWHQEQPKTIAYSRRYSCWLDRTHSRRFQFLSLPRLRYLSFSFSGQTHSKWTALCPQTDKEVVLPRIQNSLERVALEKNTYRYSSWSSLRHETLGIILKLATPKLITLVLSWRVILFSPHSKKTILGRSQALLCLNHAHHGTAP